MEKVNGFWVDLKFTKNIIKPQLSGVQLFWSWLQRALLCGMGYVISFTCCRFVPWPWSPPKISADAVLCKCGPVLLSQQTPWVAQTAQASRNPSSFKFQHQAHHYTNFKKKKQGLDEAKAGHTQQPRARSRFPNHRQRSKLSAHHGAPSCSLHPSSSISRTSKASRILLVSDWNRSPGSTQARACRCLISLGKQEAAAFF